MNDNPNRPRYVRGVPVSLSALRRVDRLARSIEEGSAAGDGCLLGNFDEAGPQLGFNTTPGIKGFWAQITGQSSTVPDMYSFVAVIGSQSSSSGAIVENQDTTYFNYPSGTYNAKEINGNAGVTIGSIAWLVPSAVEDAWEFSASTAIFPARLTSVSTGTGDEAGLNLYGFLQQKDDPTNGKLVDLQGGIEATPPTSFALELNNTLITLPTTTAPTSPSATLVAGGTLTVSTTYYYVVTTLTPLGETTVSSEVSATPTSGNQTIKITWIAPTDLPTGSTYNVYRGTAAGSEDKLVGNTSSLSFSDTGIAGTTATLPTENTTGPYVWMRYRGLAGTAPVYDFIAPDQDGNSGGVTGTFVQITSATSTTATVSGHTVTVYPAELATWTATGWTTGAACWFIECNGDIPGNGDRYPVFQIGTDDSSVPIYCNYLPTVIPWPFKIAGYQFWAVQSKTFTTATAALTLPGPGTVFTCVPATGGTTITGINPTTVRGSSNNQIVAIYNLSNGTSDNLTLAGMGTSLEDLVLKPEEAAILCYFSGAFNVLAHSVLCFAQSINGTTNAVINGLQRFNVDQSTNILQPSITGSQLALSASIQSASDYEAGPTTVSAGGTATICTVTLSSNQSTNYCNCTFTATLNSSAGNDYLVFVFKLNGVVQTPGTFDIVSEPSVTVTNGPGGLPIAAAVQTVATQCRMQLASGSNTIEVFVSCYGTAGHTDYISDATLTAILTAN